MSIDVAKVEVAEIEGLRQLYRAEMACQIIHDSFPRRGFSDPYLIHVDGRPAGYGLVANKHFPNTVNEFYTLPDYRGEALPMFRALLAASGAKKIRAQTNDRLLTLMLFDCGSHLSRDVILFADAFSSRLTCPEGALRRISADDRPALEEAGVDADADWMIESEGRPVAAGGALFHYNPPYGDIYMSVAEGQRRRGFGSYLVQELKRICREMGKIPAARCGVANVASRRTLEKAGLLPCARILSARVR